MKSMVTLYKEYLEALETGALRKAEATIQEGLSEGADPEMIYLQVMGPAIEQIGNLRKLGLADQNQEILAITITNHIMHCIQGRFEPASARDDPPTLLAACLGEETHDIGLRMVIDIFRRDGWRVLDMGKEVPPELVVALAQESTPELLVFSATLDSTVWQVKATIQILRAAGVDTPVAVGGLPFNAVQGLWRRVGANFCFQDPRFVLCAANHAVAKREKLAVAA